MKRILLLRDLYLEAFRNLGNLLVKYYFKIFFWFCFSIFIIVLYAFLYRVATGFAFD
jgi:hypothetical protein